MTCGSRCGAPGRALKLAGQVLPGGARGAVPAGVQVAGRPDHADPGPGRLPAGPARDDGRPGRRRRPATWTRSASTCRGSRARAQRDLARGLRSARFAAAAPGLARAPGRGRGRRPAQAHRRAGLAAGAHRRRAPAGAGRRRRDHRRPRRPRACTTCASAARSCATCWRSSPPCTRPAPQWRAVKELKGLQDCLGEFQDTDVQRAELRAFAAADDGPAVGAGGDAAGHGRDRGRAGPPAARGPGRVRRAVPGVRRPGRAGPDPAR